MPTSFFCSHFYTLDDHETAFMERASSTTVLQLGWLKKISLAFCGYIVLFFIACFQLFFCAVTARNCRMWWCCCYRFLSTWWLIMPSAIRFCLLVASRNERHRSTKKLPCQMRGCSPSVLRTTQFWRLRWMSALASKHLLIVFKNRPAKSPQNYQIKKWVKPYKVRRSQARALLSSPAHFTKF